MLQRMGYREEATVECKGPNRWMMPGLWFKPWIFSIWLETIFSNKILYDLYYSEKARSIIKWLFAVELPCLDTILWYVVWIWIRAISVQLVVKYTLYETERAILFYSDAQALMFLAY